MNWNSNGLFSNNMFAVIIISTVISSCSYFDFSPDLRVCDDVHTVVEQMPRLKGGMAELQGSVIYPPEARETGVEGRVTVQFVVNKLGDPTRLQVIRGIGYGADEEAVNAVEKTRFEPGKQNGKPVCVQYALSINFRLDD